MENIYYIAIFHKENDGYWVSFPDLPECFTQGETLNDAFKYAQEALDLCICDRIKNNEILPTPTMIKSNNDNDNLVLIKYNANCVAA